jgi:hypothetical protein
MKYIVYNNVMEYVRHIPCICMVYTWILEITSTTQNLRVQMTTQAGGMSCFGQNRACSAVVIALRLVPKVLGSNPAFSTKHDTCLFIVVE